MLQRLFCINRDFSYFIKWEGIIIKPPAHSWSPFAWLLYAEDDLPKLSDSLVNPSASIV